MPSLFSYLWQSALVLSVLYIPFQLLLRKEQFFALNRVILLGILLLCLTLPFSRHTMPQFVDNWLHPEVEMEAAPIGPLGEYQDWDGFIIIEDGNIEEPSSIEIHWTDLLLALWLLGTTLFLAWYSRGLWRLYKVLHDKDNTREELADGNTLLLTSSALPSFSWMHSIVISQEDYAENGETILLHERAHIAHHHSLDHLLLLVVQAIQWWNPFVWLLADALSQVHEYQADLAVLQQGTNATQYQLLLIRKAVGPAGLALVNGFKHNKLKLRIVMMNNMIKLRGAKSRYLALLPVALLALALTAKAQVKNSEQEIEIVKVSSEKNNEQAIQYIGTMEVSSEEANEHSIQYVADVKAGRIKPADNDSFMLQDLDVAPEFPNGDSFMNFINRNIRYPKSAAEKGVQGTVIVEFHIMKDGRIDYVKSFSNETNDKDLEAEAIRVVSSMPNWIPGKINGQDVNTSMFVPITFRLNFTPDKHTIGDMPYTEDMLFIYDGNVVEFEAIKDLQPTEISIGSMQLLKNGEIYEEYLKKYPKAKNGVVIMNSYSRKDQLWVVDGVPMTGEEMEAKYADGGLAVKFQQVHKDAETIAKYSQYPEAKNGVNIIITGKE